MINSIVSLLNNFFKLHVLERRERNSQIQIRSSNGPIKVAPSLSCLCIIPILDKLYQAQRSTSEAILDRSETPRRRAQIVGFIILKSRKLVYVWYRFFFIGFVSLFG